MKKPIISQLDRIILRERANSLYASNIRIFLARKHMQREFKRAFEKTLLFKFVCYLNNKF